MADDDVHMEVIREAGGWGALPYGPTFAQPQRWAETVRSYDRPDSNRPRCSGCLSREGVLCSCHGAFYCCPQHQAQDTVHTNSKQCRDGTEARLRVEALVPVLAEVRGRGLNPFDPEPPTQIADANNPEFTASTNYRDALVDWFRALLRMPAGTAVRKAFEVHALLNGELFLSPSYSANYVHFESFKTDVLPILQMRTGREVRSWATTVKWAHHVGLLAMADQMGVQVDPMYTDNSLPDLIHPIDRIFEPNVVAWHEHELEPIVSHFVLKLKCLLALETAEKARLLAMKQVTDVHGVTKPFPFELIRLIQRKAASPLLLWSPEFNRLLLRGERFDGMIQTLRCHVQALACHIHSNNEAFWPHFMHPEHFLADPNPDDFMDFSDRWRAQEVLRLYFPAIAETSGALEWCLNNAVPCQFSYDFINQLFSNRAWGHYP